MVKTIFSKEHQKLVEKIRQAREEAGFDQIRVAKLLNKTQSHISKLESGQRRIDIFQLKEFAKIYKKPIDYFLK